MARAKVMFNGSLYEGDVIGQNRTRILVKFTTGTGTERERLFRRVDRPEGEVVSRRAAARRRGFTPAAETLPAGQVMLEPNTGFLL